MREIQTTWVSTVLKGKTEEQNEMQSMQVHSSSKGDRCRRFNYLASTKTIILLTSTNHDKCSRKEDEPEMDDPFNEKKSISQDTVRQCNNDLKGMSNSSLAPTLKSSSSSRAIAAAATLTWSLLMKTIILILVCPLLHCNIRQLVKFSEVVLSRFRGDEKTSKMNSIRRVSRSKISCERTLVILGIIIFLTHFILSVSCMGLESGVGVGGGSGINSLTSDQNERQQYRHHQQIRNSNSPVNNEDVDNDSSSSSAADDEDFASHNNNHHQTHRQQQQQQHHRSFNGNHVREPILTSSHQNHHQHQEQEQQSNAINRNNDDENGGLNNDQLQQRQFQFGHHPQFYGPQDLQNSPLKKLLEKVDRGCPSYCADQAQFNSICITEGCRNWKTGLRVGCSSVCNESENNFLEVYACQVGCSKAIEEYYFRVTGLIGVPDPPTLISDSLQSSSLRLIWEGSALPLPYLAFTVQRRVFPRSSQWETIPMTGSATPPGSSSSVSASSSSSSASAFQPPLNTTTFTVQSLKPFTEYQFRIGWILAHDFPPYYSKESNPIETLPKGLPNPPEITSIQPISNTSVSITWLPPSQPNGRLIAYILKLRKLPDGHIIIKEIPISQNPRGYTFTGLQPITNYSLEISAQNGEGEGETANINFVTPQSSLSNDISEKPEPRLLVQGIRDVYIQHLDLLLDPDVYVFNSSQNISAMASHFKYKWVFIATGEGDIIRTNLEPTDEANPRKGSITIVQKRHLDLVVAFLDVDWLHNHLYIVGKKKMSSNWTIKRCDLNGQNLVTIYTYMFEKPVDFAVDPYTGYMYWVRPTTQLNRGGLFKLDLMSTTEFANGPYPIPIPIIEGQDLGPFVVDSLNYRILIVHKGRNTVLAVSLDGDITDIRSNTQSPQFEDAISIAWYSGIFYWTTGQSIVIEEYNAAQDSYYQNLYDVSKAHQPCTRIMVVHPDLQPIPVPMAPPQRVQVIYGQTRARVSWRPPPVIAGLGEGSWRRWSYHVRIADTNVSYENITDVEFIVRDLRPSTFYTIQVAATSPGGKGPFSPPLRGKTLRDTQYNITFLWGSQSGLYATNTLGENVELLAPPNFWLGSSSFNGTFSPNNPDPKFMFQGPSPTSASSPAFAFPGGSSSLYMSSLTWFDSLVFFALSNGSVYYYDTVNVLQESMSPGMMSSSNSGSARRNEITKLGGVPNAQSIAFDYIGQKLYWSNPKQQTILRCSFIEGAVGNRNNLAKNVDTVNPCSLRERAERLQVVTMAREICVDSYKGMLLWSTGHSLEMSWLNGYSHRTLYQTGLFSGIHIMGITLDTDQSRIYWITRSSTGSTLQRLSYNIRGAQLPMIIANYDDTSITGPIRYFNDRLIWLQGPSEAVITDLYGQGKSSLTINTISNITNLHVRDQSSLKYPGGLPRSKIQVYPDPVLKWTIRLQGKWDNFTISWSPVNNTNYGKILYEVVVNNSISKITMNPNMTIENGTLFKPYSDLDVTITSLTYWASSKPITTRLKTPSMRPSEPVNPRVFVQKLSYPYLPKRTVTNLSTAQSSSSVSVELRWDVPKSPNGLILGYLIHCWRDTMKKTDCMCDVDMSKSPQKPSCEIQNLQPSSTYYFAIQAFTDIGAGNLSTRVLADTTFNTPVPKLLLTTADKMQILDIDRNDVQSLPLGYLSPRTVTHFAKEDTLFWFNEGQDLMFSRVKGSSPTNKTRIMSLASLQAEASNLVVDWIGRKLYWAYEVTSPTSSTSPPSSVLEEKYGVMSYDLVPSWGNHQSPTVVISSKTPVRSVAVNPFRKSLYWTTSRRNGITTLFTSELDGTSPRQFLARNLETCNCSTLSSTGDPIAFDPHGIGGTEFTSGILFVDKQAIWMSDDNGCNCIHLVNLSNLPFLQNSPYRIAGDQHRVYWAEGILFASEKMSKGGVVELQPVGAGVTEVSTLGPISQPFPDINCLVPQKMDPREPILFNHSSHSLHLQLPQPVTVNCSLGEVSLPTPRYNVYYGTVNENGISECTPTSSSFCKVVTTLENMLHITDLHPYTTYTVFVTVTNYYAEQNGEKPLGCSPIMLRTAPGAPMPPTLLRLEPLTPVSVRVVWRQPEKLNGEKVWYEVHWQTGGRNSPKHDGQKWAETETRSNRNRTEYYLDLIDLLPDSNYSIWVVAYSEKGDAFSGSEKQFVKTFPHPNNITLLKASPHNMTISWIAPNDTSILEHQIIYRDGWSTQWNQTERVNFTIPFKEYTLNITSLKPKTLYGFRIITRYIGNRNDEFVWPLEGQFNFETLADKPGKPGTPIARGIGRSLYEITWEKADENGAAIEMYSLECKMEVEVASAAVGSSSSLVVDGGQNQSIAGVRANNNTIEKKQSSRTKRENNAQKRNVEEGVALAAEKLISTEGGAGKIGRKIIYTQWVVVYNGTDARWQVEGLDIDKQYNFRVRAKNVYGWGEYSPESISVSLAALTLVAESQGFGIVLGSIFLACLTLGTCAFLTLFLYRGRLKEKPILNGTLSSSERREVELATLRELPGGSTFIHQSNILYAGDLLMDMDFAGIAKVHRHQISFTKFLGSGAFGEVYEGIANGLMSPQDETRVAIKTLRKGASNIEKVEFVQEAKLMVQFQHPHIIQLLGICVDTDPCCLLLELMTGGDLLSYLRSHRPHLGSTTSLTIIDLLRMCVDVAKGCVYLEEMHFVHRDLAARNCLVQLENIAESNGEGGVSASNGSGDSTVCRRVVKIGDFGLARDIYRNDYYRKEGEGLLPVRWMAPESLVDGVFTTQSDVWAFGVLLWEIMTLGQQPYPARNNLEVLHYVRGGGRLHQPLHCPQPLGQLMLRCWEYNADNRPSFRDCLSDLEGILHSYESIFFNNPHPTQGQPLTTSVPQNDDTDKEDEYGFRTSTNAEVHHHNPHRFVDPYRTQSTGPKYIEVIAESSGSDHNQNSAYGPHTSSLIHHNLLRPNLNEGYEIPLPRKPPRRKLLEGNHSFSASSQSSSHSPAPEYGLPSPKYWNVDVSSPTSPSHSQSSFNRCNSTSSNLPLLHKKTSSSSASTLTTTETRNEAFVQDSYDDVQYTEVSCPDYHLHQIPLNHDDTSIVYGAVGGVVDESLEDDSITHSESTPSPVYAYHSYRPATSSATNYSHNLNYHRHHHQHQPHHHHHGVVESTINNPQRFSRQTIDTCGSG